jgi:type II secretory pathway component PulC
VSAGIGGLIIVGILAASYASTETQTHSREVPSFQKYQVISEKNMFSPRRGVGRKEEKAGEKQPPGSASLPPDIRVVGIVRMDDSPSSIAIVEEGGRHRLCRIGDTVGAAIIRDIRRDTLVLETPGGRWIAEIQPGTMSRQIVTPQVQRAIARPAPARRSPTVSRGRRLPIKAAEIPRLARDVWAVIETREDEAKGLRLARDFMDLREGDRVTHVRGQSLRTGHPKQKLWQIARKLSMCGEQMPEVSILVERGDTTLEFVLSPSS